MTLARSGWCAALCLVAAACDGAGARAPTAARAAAITAGTPDSGDPAVVAVVARRSACEDTTGNLLCSGTLVSPRVVATSAHCLPDPTALLEVYFGNTLGTDPQGQFSVVIEAQADPAYDPTTHEHDLLLLALADPAPVAPLALPSLALDAGAVGKGVRIVGFGTTVAGQSASGVKQQGTMTISAVDAATFQTTVAPSNSCKGDSGGPLLLSDGSGGEQLIGLTTSGDVDCASFALNVRVDALASEIQTFIDHAATLPTGRPSGNIAPGAVCTTACASNADCPDGLVCFPAEPDRNLCLLVGPAAASYGSDCQTSSDCGGHACARLWPSGADACRCASPCAGTPTPPTMKKSGCELAGAAPGTSPLALAPLWLVLLGWRRLRRA